MTNLLNELGANNVLGPTLGSIITSLVVVFVARRYTIRTKRIDSTFEFSKRYHELLIQQRDLNEEYDKLLVDDPKRADERPADVWWLRFFDLMLFEYEFFKQRLLMKERFEDWMKWRWHEFRGTDEKYKNFAWGMGYRDGWKRLREAEVWQGNPLIPFLHDVHHATDVNEVKRIVEEAYPSWWREVQRRLPAFMLVPVLILLLSLVLWHETANLGGRLRDLEMQRDRFAGQLSLVDHEMANQYLAVARDRNGSQKLASLQRALNYEREAKNIRPTGGDARDNMKSSCDLLQEVTSQLKTLDNGTDQVSKLREEFGASCQDLT
ncbi:MAG TPA: hypothetical protein VIH87_01885 [Methylocella sp.]